MASDFQRVKLIYRRPPWRR